MTKNPDLLVKLNNAGANISSKWLVRGVSFELFKGQILTLIGPNGSGKTTTAKMVLNILNADEGSIEIHTNKLAYVPQKLNIDWTLPLRVADFMNITSKISNTRILECLKLTGVNSLMYSDIKNLSGGEFQRVLLARAIAKKPELLVLDEPVQGVDFNGEIALYNLIKDISDQLNCGILLISHDIHFVMSSTDHVICLNGHICCSGTPSTVTKNPAYIELFGEHSASALSLYKHHHDHSHGSDGSIEK
jgi:zinc transport system ATP-binding protein|tara:strand:+ start:1117 stop:1860 length:744 start_codon:yes stop_codon:yes gene_type:complete